MALKPGQQKCIETLDRSLVVAAGAGSGKTFTLTKRVVHAIRSGAVDGIERVCAITFTNKAAGELKARIKAELRACGMAEQALKVDEAWISTIHGMCARILRAHAVELDIDPLFKMADPVVAGPLLEHAVDNALAGARASVMPGEPSCGDGAGWSAEEWNAAVDALFAEYPARTTGMGGNSVERMLHAIMGATSSNPRGFDALLVEEPRVNEVGLLLTVIDTYEALAQASRAQKANATREAWADTVEERAASLRAEVEGGRQVDALWALRALDTLPAPGKTGTADYKQQVVEALDVYRVCVMELRLCAAAPHMLTLVELARRAQASYAAAKRAAGVLDNDDLLVLASDAIANKPEIAALYTDKFQLIMVDEFQDTDQMQVDMIKRLAGPGACRLCTVGDAQQSIYRFRGADVSVYRRHLESVRAGSPDDVILLPDNFRSHADVLALVDRVFERSDMFGGEFMSLAPARDELRVKRALRPGVPRVQVQLTSNAHRGASADDVRQVAAARLADAFAEFKERGHSAGEMALLLGGMAHAGVYAEALRRRGLACVITGGSVFSETPEAKLVCELVRVAANPYQTASLYNVLTSPLFDLRAADLLRLATSTGRDGLPRRRNLCDGLRACAAQLHKDGPDPAWSPQLVLAVRVLGAFVRGVGRSQVSRLAMRVIVDSGWISRLRDEGAEGLARAANAYKAIRMVESVEKASAAGPAATAAAFQVLLADSKEAPGALSATGGDFVRIMTVHASKGLEFPIVGVAEFRDRGSRSPRLYVADVAGSIRLSLDLQNSIAALDGPAKLKDLGSLYEMVTDGCATEDDLEKAAMQADGALALRAALCRRDTLGDDEESKRLLYVALTRAKEALVVSLRGKRTKDNPCATPKSCLGALAPALAGEGEGFAVGRSLLDFGGSAPAVVEHVALEADDPALQADDAPDGEMDQKAFAVPAVEERPFLVRVPFAPAHEGIFSYSSIADASHGSDVVEQLAQVAFVSADDAAAEFGEALDAPGDSSAHVSDFELGMRRANRVASAADEDDGTWAYIGASCDDSDKATDLGTAFHRLAQYAVVVRGDGEPLEVPPDTRVQTLARACTLDVVQRARLDAALGRWFGSELARAVSGFADVRAEVPFFVKIAVGDDPAPAFLEGEIDLLALDADAKRAVVVDYKTGGMAGESAAELRVKHVLQASCYALAIMRQGIREVDAVFARVERPRADSPVDPQCVRYRFEAKDAPVLERAIAQLFWARMP